MPKKYGKTNAVDVCLEEFAGASTSQLNRSCKNAKNKTAIEKSKKKQKTSRSVSATVGDNAKDSEEVKDFNVNSENSRGNRKRKAEEVVDSKKSGECCKTENGLKREKSQRKNLTKVTSKQKEEGDEGENVSVSAASCLNEFSLRPMKKILKIISWNVAGVRAWIKKDAHQILYELSPDIFGLQETKCNCVPEGLNLEGYHHYLESPVENAGRAGVMLLTKQKPSAVVYGSNVSTDASGRLIIAEFDSFFLVNSYVPNSGRGLVNLGNRKVWEDWFLDKIKELDSKKPVIYTGDLNVAHQEIDLANPKTNKNKTAGFTDQERDDFTRLLDAGFIDVYRKINPKKNGAYTFWSNMHGARAKNIGWRLDYFVISERMFGCVKKCEIMPEYLGSDHCPISLEIVI